MKFCNKHIGFVDLIKNDYMRRYGISVLFVFGGEDLKHVISSGFWRGEAFDGRCGGAREGVGRAGYGHFPGREGPLGAELSRIKLYIPAFRAVRKNSEASLSDGAGEQSGQVITG